MIVLATTTRAEVPAQFAGDLVRLCRHRPDVRFVAALGIYIANLRQHCVRIAQQTSASHLCFLDADMRFPADTLDRLLAADVDIVAANYVQRTMPMWWTARVEGQWVSSLGRTGLQCVDAVGCGVMLIRMAVFDMVAAPWFSTPYDGQTHIGEDVYFCRQATAAGVSVWIDHDLSQLVRHQGVVEWGAENAPQAQMAQVSDLV